MNMTPRELQKVYKPTVQQLQIAQMTKPSFTESTSPSTTSTLECYLCGNNHPLHKCPQLDKLMTHEKGKSTLKRILETHLLLQQICEDDHHETPQDTDETDNDDHSYATTQDEEEELDFPQAG